MATDALCSALKLRRSSAARQPAKAALSATSLLLCPCLAPWRGLGSPQPRRRELRGEGHFGAASCLCASDARSLASVTVALGAFPEQASWSLSEQGGGAAAAPSNGACDSEAAAQSRDCLADGCYALTISDAAGGGICCALGSGSCAASADGKALASGGSLAASEKRLSLLQWRQRLRNLKLRLPTDQTL